MTQNQIAYWNMRETQRSNQAAERQKQWQLELDNLKHQEQMRYNSAQERLRDRELSNYVVQTALKAQELRELQRSHKSVESETRRANLERERNARDVTSTAERSLLENIRSNKTAERETERMHKASEANTLLDIQTGGYGTAGELVMKLINTGVNAYNASKERRISTSRINQQNKTDRRSNDLRQEEINVKKETNRINKSRNAIERSKLKSK